MYSIEAEYPLFLCLQLEAIDLFAVFEYNEHVSVLSFSFRVFFFNLKKICKDWNNLPFLKPCTVVRSLDGVGRTTTVCNIASYSYMMEEIICHKKNQNLNCSVKKGSCLFWMAMWISVRLRLMG